MGCPNSVDPLGTLHFICDKVANLNAVAPENPFAAVLTQSVLDICAVASRALWKSPAHGPVDDSVNQLALETTRRLLVPLKNITKRSNCLALQSTV